MNEIETELKKQHRFIDFLYWNMVVALPIVTACIGIFKASLIWMIFYIIVCIGLVAMIYRFYCTHCPHYIQGANTTRCMFFWGIPKYFESKPGPLSLFEKTVSFAAPIIMILIPLYWLILQPGLLAIYVLSLAVLVATIRRNECSRCIYFHCPVNCVPEDIKDQAQSNKGT
ncbi:MAG: hypothetical protein JRJ21_03395 [Deltaproteobacteria bacterium]|nr:hypothetical protein [Deltaproteobacteria bacterium]